MNIVYILESLKDGSYYTGFTTDIDQRLKDHNSGSNKYSTSKKPYKLIWYCVFQNKEKAMEFEKYLKSGSGFAIARKRFI